MDEDIKTSKLRLKAIATEMRGSGEEEPLSPRSAMFFEKGFDVHVLALIGLKTKVDAEVFNAQFPNTLLQHPRFTSIVVGDTSNGEKLHWVKQDNVDPLDHIVVPKIGLEAMADPDKYIEDYLYSLSETSVDRSKPLWELHIINLKTSYSEAVVIFRIHHSLGDGFSLISLLLACTRQVADPTAVPTIPVTKTHKHRKANEVGRTSMVWWEWWHMLFVWVYGIMELWWNTAVDVAKFIATSIYLSDTVMRHKSGSKTLGHTPRRIIFKTVSLDDIKFIKNAFNGTINDVLLGITQAGLSKYLNRRYGDNEKKNNLPANTRLRSTVMVNTRPSASIQTLADMMEKNTKIELGNRIGFVLLPFSIAIRDDPLDYIRSAKATVDRKKRSFEALFTFYICKLSHKLLGIKKAGAISHSAVGNTTLLFSNVVGPMEEIQFFGHRLQFIAPTTYGLPLGLIIHFLSYVDKLTIVVSVDEETVPDAPQLCKDIVDSLALIKEDVIAKGLAG